MNSGKNKRRCLALLAAAGIVTLPFFVPGGVQRLSGFRHWMLDASGSWAGAVVGMPVWLLAMMWALILAAAGAALWIVVARREKAEPPRLRATSAEIFGIRWRWTNDGDEMRGIAAFCPKCDREVAPFSEARHGFLHLISYRCECRKWSSKSFHCSQADILERVRAAVRSDGAMATRTARQG